MLAPARRTAATRLVPLLLLLAAGSAPALAAAAPTKAKLDKALPPR